MDKQDRAKVNKLKKALNKFDHKELTPAEKLKKNNEQYDAIVNRQKADKETDEEIDNMLY